MPRACGLRHHQRLGERAADMARKLLPRHLRDIADKWPAIVLTHDHASSVVDSGERLAFHQFVHGGRYQPILHMADAVVPKIIDEVAPGIVELLDRSEEHTSELQSPSFISYA